MITIQVGVTQEQFDNLEMISSLSGNSRARIIRDLLDRYERELRQAIARLEKDKGYLL